MKKLQETFKSGSSYIPFLISIVLTGLSYGLYKGVLDNYLAEIVQINEFQRGVAEFFREAPGLLLVLFLAVFYMLSAETIYKLGAVFMLVGFAMHAIVPPTIVWVIAAIFVMSIGEHLQLGMTNILPLQYAKEGKGGEALGYKTSATNVGHLAGYLVVAIAFMFIQSTEKSYKAIFWIVTVLMGIALISSLKVEGRSEQDKSRSRFYFRKKFFKYYALEVFYGARKQVFFTFGPYVLILFYGASATLISFLFAISAVACMLTAPIVGKIIDKYGYKIVMVSDTLILVLVCFAYGFAHHIFPKDVAFVVCCINYVLDAIISQASMASNVYVQDISDSPEETRATISTGISVNHLITILVALFGGYIWQELGIETLFIISAILGICNSAYAATIKVSKK